MIEVGTILNHRNGQISGERSLAKLRLQLICQDFIGHRTHATLLERYCDLDGSIDSPSVFRLSAANTGQVGKALLKLAGARMPLTPIRGLDFGSWKTRGLFVQGALASRMLHKYGDATELVYIHSHSAALAFHSLPRTAPLVISLDGTFRAEARMSKTKTVGPDLLAYKLEKDIFERADLIVAFSDWARSSVCNDYGIIPEKTVTIRNAVLPIKHVEPRPGLLPDNGLPIIGFVANGLKRKGGDLLIEAHQRHLSKHSNLVLVTADRIRESDLENVTVLRPLPREILISQVIPRFSLYAHPARKDWSPYSVIEALAAGLPVVASSVGSIPEMVESGRNGILLSKPTVESLSDSLREILQDDSLRRKMSHQSSLIFQERYNAEINYPVLINTLKSVVYGQQEHSGGLPDE